VTWKKIYSHRNKKAESDPGLVFQPRFETMRRRYRLGDVENLCYLLLDEGVFNG
jgi:hypothetical protein